MPEIGVDVEFPMDDFTQFRLVEGLDDIGLTLRHVDDIAAYELQRSDLLPESEEHSAEMGISAQIALLPGDGTGPEIVEASKPVLAAIQKTFGHRFDPPKC